MFAVYRTNSDGCTYTADTVLFVTADEQTARTYWWDNFGK